MSDMLAHLVILALIFMGAMVGLLITVVALLLLFVRRVAEIVLSEYFRRKTLFINQSLLEQEDIVDG